MLYEVSVEVWATFLIAADSEEEATRQVEQKLKYAEIDPFEIRDWEIDNMVEIEEEDE